MSVETTGAANQIVQPFQFKSVKQIYEAPAEVVSYCIDGLLPSSGMSVLAGKPKAGKTTLARQLAVCVSQGNAFLNRVTQKGEVLYLALEEKESEVALHFQQLGLHENDPVHIRCGAVEKHLALATLEASLKARPEVKLVIIDPLFRFVGVKDSNDYIQVNNALEKLLELARNYSVHILAVHHMKKRETEDVQDGALGSTAIVGGVDTYLALKADNTGVRTLCTRQRYGRDMEPTILNWDADSRELSLGLTREDADRIAASETTSRIESEMIQYVKDNEGCTQQALLNAVRGKREPKLRVMQKLIDSSFFVQAGGGVKGDPYTYTLASLSVETSTSSM